jgi:hypothetical protein
VRPSLAKFCCSIEAHPTPVQQALVRNKTRLVSHAIAVADVEPEIEVAKAVAPAELNLLQGTEVGLTQEKSAKDGWGLEVSRMPMLWGEAQDKDLLQFYKDLISKRKAR